MRFLALAFCTALLATAQMQAPRRICKNRCESDYRLCMKRSANAEGRKTCNAMRKSCDRGCPPK